MCCCFICTLDWRFINNRLWKITKWYWYRANTQTTCDNCGAEIKFKYFFPVLGYILSRGKCVHCKKPIPKVYLWLELAVATYIILMSFQYKIIDEKFISKALCGAYLYECLNIKSNEIVLKHAGYLKQFKDRKSSKTTAGRKRKWIIIKKPYIE